MLTPKTPTPAPANQSCACPDDRCDGYHHAVNEPCGCSAWVEERPPADRLVFRYPGHMSQGQRDRAAAVRTTRWGALLEEYLRAAMTEGVTR